MTGRTTLIVAHRLSAVQQADLIYVLEDGQVIQTGTHGELVQQKGLYQTLYGIQPLLLLQQFNHKDGICARKLRRVKTLLILSMTH